MHEGTTDFLKMFVCLVAAGLFLWWLRNDFGANYALIAVVLTAGTVFFIGGAILTHQIQKNTLDGVSKFSAKDAMTDRYRMQSLREISKGQSWQLKADAQKQIIDYKAEKKLLTSQPKPDENETFWSNNETVDLDEWS